MCFAPQSSLAFYAITITESYIRGFLQRKQLFFMSTVPAMCVRVLLMSSNGVVANSTITDTLGYFEFEDVDPQNIYTLLFGMLLYGSEGTAMHCIKCQMAPKKPSPVDLISPKRWSSV